MNIPILDKQVRQGFAIVPRTLTGPYCYHIGNLQEDRLRDPVADAEAKSMWSRYLAGEIELVQRRVTGLGVQYLAIPKRAPHKPVDYHGGVPGLSVDENYKRLRLKRLAGR